VTAPDPERAVAEARERLERNIAAEAGYQWAWDRMPADARDDWREQINALIAAVRADERARLLATQDDADAQAQR
jgi:hypothetical protein